MKRLIFNILATILIMLLLGFAYQAYKNKFKALDIPANNKLYVTAKSGDIYLIGNKRAICSPTYKCTLDGKTFIYKSKNNYYLVKGCNYEKLSSKKGLVDKFFNEKER